MLYECLPLTANYRVVTPRWFGFKGTDVRRGTVFRQLVGNEADRVYPIPSTPRRLQILSYVKYSCRGVETSSQSIYYTVPSGAGVFNAGTLRWQCAITRRCDVKISRPTSTFVRTVTRNILRMYARGPVGERHPAIRNVGRFDLPRVNQVPAS
jgi:hypothetical protein